MNIVNTQKRTPTFTGIIGLMYGLLVALILILLMSSCTSDDLAFEVIESPVLAVFEESIDSQEGMITMTATFYELDKSGILDLSIGIDSTLITGLDLKVFINEETEVGTLTTDANGQAVFKKSLGDLGSASRLEWVGTYENTPFRIYRNF